MLPKYVKSTRRVNTALFYTSSIKLGLQSIQTSVWPHYSGLDLNAASPLAEWSKSDPLTVNTVTMKIQFCLKFVLLHIIVLIQSEVCGVTLNQCRNRSTPNAFQCPGTIQDPNGSVSVSLPVSGAKVNSILVVYFLNDLPLIR